MASLRVNNPLLMMLLQRPPLELQFSLAEYYVDDGEEERIMRH